MTADDAQAVALVAGHAGCDTAATRRRADDTYNPDTKEIGCGACGAVYRIGDSPFCRDGHAAVKPRGGFEPHFDPALGEYVTGWGDVRQHMRRKGLDFRDHPSKSWLNERKDRLRERQEKRA